MKHGPNIFVQKLTLMQIKEKHNKRLYFKYDRNWGFNYKCNRLRHIGDPNIGALRDLIDLNGHSRTE